MLHSAAGERAAEPIAIERLQQVIERRHLERLNGVLIVCGYENDDRATLGIELLQNSEPVQLRHLHVQEHQVGR